MTATQQPTTHSASFGRTEFERAEQRTAHNYHPLPVVVAHAEGAWMTDVDGRRYLDLLAGYSALNFGHGHPALVRAAHAQLDQLTLTSRAFLHDQFADFCAELGDLCGKDLVLPMNTGAEAVETAIKVARKWGYDVKGVPADQARIIVASGNFHGRTTTIVGFSDDPDARGGFGPFTPGFVTVPYGDLAALEAAIDDHTVAVLLEPIQGEGGVVIPPDGYLRGVRELCTRRTCCSPPTRSSPASAVPARRSPATTRTSCRTCTCWARRWAAASSPSRRSSPTSDVLGVLQPRPARQHLRRQPAGLRRRPRRGGDAGTGEYQARAPTRRPAARPARGHDRPRRRRRTHPRPVGRRRHRPRVGTGRVVCEALMARGVLAKDTHGSTIRLAPPLVISPEDLMWGIDQLEAVVSSA